MLTPNQRQILLRVARESIIAATKNQSYQPMSNDPALLAPGAAFVTIHKGQQLRGCIGCVEPREPLIENVANMARCAALEDYRFHTVHHTEVPELRLEISVMGAPEHVTDINKIEVGRHGLIIEQGPMRGLLLPQVPVEWGWDREEFLDHCCLKAGLPKNAWRRGADLYAFTAEVFGEDE